MGRQLVGATRSAGGRNAAPLIWLVAFGTAASCDCGSETASLTVDVRTDFVPGVEFTLTQVELSSGESETRLGLMGENWLTGQRFGPFDGLTPGAVNVEATLINGSTIVARRSAVVEVRDRVAATFVFTRDCASVACPRDGDSAAATECLGGQCVDPACLDGTQDECPAPCEADDACPMSVCSASRCVDGVCLWEPAFCEGDDLYCVPELDQCIEIPTAMSDAGDGGPEMSDGSIDGDTGMDADIDSVRCLAGEPCDPGHALRDCEQALTICIDGQPSCQVSVVSAAGARLCRDAAGDCDSPEFCDGTSAECPTADMVLPAGTVCRAVAGDCDVAETCDGADPECPMDAVVDSGVVCRSSQGLCDSEEVCDGISGTCPDDTGAAAATVVCRPSAGECDAAENCDGTSLRCPDETFTALGTPCATGFCDGAGMCSSSLSCSDPCPTNNACEDGVIVCDAGIRCEPQGPTSGGTECRAAGEGDSIDAECDIAEACNGSGLSCPMDAFAPLNTPCSGSQFCDGNGHCVQCTAATQCDDGNVCTQDLCSNQSCANPSEPAGTACSLGTMMPPGVCDGASISPTCVQCLNDLNCADPAPVCDTDNTCVQCTSPSHCDDGDPCTDDDCNGNTCGHTANNDCSIVDVATSTGNQGHTCVVQSDGAGFGAVWCWGANSQNQAGVNSGLEVLDAAEVQGITDAVAVTLGGSHSCALHASGQVSCWGRDAAGQLGDGSVRTGRTATPVFATGLMDIDVLSAGGDTTCAVHSGGKVSCWGSNRDGQLGNGTSGEMGGNAHEPGLVMNLSDAVDVSVGNNHVCAQRLGGELVCWGQNSQGQLGDNTTTDSALPVTVMGPTTMRSVSAGSAHTCAIDDSDGEVYCWGLNSAGAVGDGTMTQRRTVPTLVPGLTGVRQVDVDAHSCALLSNRTVQCWGNGRVGQIGDGTRDDRLSPVTVGGLIDVDLVSAGASHACALGQTGSLECWGSNQSGQLGIGTTHRQPVPLRVFGISTATHIVAGQKHTCARVDDGALTCWGDNTNGQLGDGTQSDRSTETEVSSDMASLISAGSGHTCFIDDVASLNCWGQNSQGQVGDGTTTTPRLSPQSVLSSVADVGTGTSHTCAVTTLGAVLCWGDNSKGQVGDGTMTRRETPTAITGGHSAVQVSAGNEHSCAVLADSEIICWGDNQHGQLGDGTNTRRLDPVTVDFDDPLEVAAGNRHTCARNTDQTVSCWGSHQQGVLGNGAGVGSTTPVAVPGLTNVVQISTGNVEQSHVCARRSDGTVSCWGSNAWGQLGDGTIMQRDLPTMVAGLPGAALDLSVGTQHTCAVVTGGEIYCWGTQEAGRLGYKSLWVPETVLPLGG